MKKLVFVITTFLIILSGCSKDIEDFRYHNSDSFLTIVKWKISRDDKIFHYEFKERPGIGKLTICWVNTNMQVGGKTVDAKMSKIEQGDGFISFKINGTKYIYRHE